METLGLMPAERNFFFRWIRASNVTFVVSKGLVLWYHTSKEGATANLALSQSLGTVPFPALATAADGDIGACVPEIIGTN